jgi:hypothetical protein
MITNCNTPGVHIPLDNEYEFKHAISVDKTGFKFYSSSLIAITTGIRAFAKCRTLCRVPFLGHSAKMALPRAALGKVQLSVTESSLVGFGVWMTTQLKD